jgi:hypothetical protein
MNLEAVMLMDGSMVMLNAKEADKVRARIRQQQKWSQIVSRECSQLNPGLYGAGLKGRSLGQVSGSNYVRPTPPASPVARITTPQEWRAFKASERKTLIDSRWKTITA